QSREAKRRRGAADQVRQAVSRVGHIARGGEQARPIGEVVDPIHEYVERGQRIALRLIGDVESRGVLPGEKDVDITRDGGVIPDVDAVDNPSWLTRRDVIAQPASLRQ